MSNSTALLSHHAAANNAIKTKPTAKPITSTATPRQSSPTERHVANDSLNSESTPIKSIRYHQKPRHVRPKPTNLALCS